MFFSLLFSRRFYGERIMKINYRLELCIDRTMNTLQNVAKIDQHRWIALVIVIAVVDTVARPRTLTTNEWRRTNCKFASNSCTKSENQFQLVHFRCVHISLAAILSICAHPYTEVKCWWTHTNYSSLCTIVERQNYVRDSIVNRWIASSVFFCYHFLLDLVWQNEFTFRRHRAKWN